MVKKALVTSQFWSLDYRNILTALERVRSRFTRALPCSFSYEERLEFFFLKQRGSDRDVQNYEGQAEGRW